MRVLFALIGAETYDNHETRKKVRPMKTKLSIWVLALAAILALRQDSSVQGQSSPAGFEGEKTNWHGFDRYDFLMDEQTLTIKPAVNKGKSGVKGQRPCIVVVPKAAASGNPWSWQGCYWDHEPQAEVELLKRGFHIAFVAPDADRQGRVWDTWYKFLTEKHGLAKRAAFIGMSKGGVNEFNWGVVNRREGVADASMPIIPHCTTKTSPKFRSWPSMIYLYCTFAALRISCCNGTLVSSRTCTTSRVA